MKSRKQKQVLAFGSLLASAVLLCAQVVGPPEKGVTPKREPTNSTNVPILEKP